MIGEFDFGSSFTMDTIRQSSVMTSYNDFTLFIFPVLVQLAFVGMLFLGSITIGNLIIGLTSHHITQLYMEEEIFRLVKAVRQIGKVENIGEKMC